MLRLKSKALFSGLGLFEQHLRVGTNVFQCERAQYSRLFHSLDLWPFQSRAPSMETSLTLTLSRKLPVSPFTSELGNTQLTLNNLVEISKGKDGA